MGYDIDANHHQELPIPRVIKIPSPKIPKCVYCANNRGDCNHWDGRLLPKPKVKRWQGSKWIRRARRLRIYARDGWRCIWCRCRVAIGAKARSKHLALAHLDHVKPRVLGGSNATENLITSCKRCNDKRGSTPAHVYAQRVGAMTRLLEAIGKVLP